MRTELAALLLFSAGAFAQVPLDSPVNFVNYHVRVEPERFRDGLLTVKWNGTRSARIKIPCTSSADPLLGTTLAYSIFDGDSCLARGEVPADYSSAGVSAVLAASRSGGMLSLGSGESAADIPVPFDCDVPVGVDIEAERVKVLRNNLITHSLPPQQYVDSIAFGNDPLEGHWAYLDGRKINASDRAMRLALMHDGPGRYVMAADDRQIVGRLTAMPFEGSYDMEWVGESDAYAVYDSRLRLLTLHFPAAGKKIRLRREAIF